MATADHECPGLTGALGQSCGAADTSQHRHGSARYCRQGSRELDSAYAIARTAPVSQRRRADMAACKRGFPKDPVKLVLGFLVLAAACLQACIAEAEGSDSDVIRSAGSESSEQRTVPSPEVISDEPRTSHGSSTISDEEALDMQALARAPDSASTDRFRRWEWWFRDVLDAYAPYRPYFEFRIAGERIRAVEYWTVDPRDQSNPTDQSARRFEQYDANGRITSQSSYSNELGFVYSRYRYDQFDRLVDVEIRSSEEDVGFALAQVLHRQSFWLQYSPGPGLGSETTRSVASYDNTRNWIDVESKIDGGWEYSSGRSTDSVLRLIGTYGVASPWTVEHDVGVGTRRVSYWFDASGRVVRTQETLLDGTTPRVTTSYERNSGGWLVEANEWDNRNDAAASRREFLDHDQNGNWRRQVIMTDGEINSIIVRRIIYW